MINTLFEVEATTEKPAVSSKMSWLSNFQLRMARDLDAFSESKSVHSKAPSETRCTVQLKWSGTLFLRAKENKIYFNYYFIDI